MCGEGNTGPSVVFVHGLFVNADHFRNNLPAAAAVILALLVTCSALFGGKMHHSVLYIGIGMSILLNVFPKIMNQFICTLT